MFVFLFIILILHDITVIHFLVTEVMEVLRKLLIDLDSKFSEQNLINPDYNGKLCLYLDEMMPEGIIETLDIETIIKMSKFKNS